ncbi:MAG: hypothetical protein ACE5OS_02175 [Anaerolineae bacterium]
MLKAGLIGAGVGFVLAIIAAVLTPLCNPCVALLLGLGVGVLAAVWERPATSGAGAGEGAKAGAIASVGSLIGQMVGAVINGFIVGPETLANLYRQFDIPVPTAQSYWIYNLGGNCLCAVVNVALGAALGAVGGLLWHQISGKD